MSKYIMALDQGTTSSRCIIYDKQGQQISIGQREFAQYFPREGWVEHDAEEIWTSQMTVATEALLKAGLTCHDIDSIGITNQRETTIVWNRHTGVPICHAIVWQCRRTADYCDELGKDKALVERIRQKTGLILDPYFSGTKLRWILENLPGARSAAEAGDLLFGTVETWLIWKMTGGKVHVTDYSNASRTMLFNIHDLCWDEEILKLLDIPASMLPTPVPCSQVYGETMEELFGGPIPIAGAAGDQQAALFGQTCFSPGEAKSTYGTGNFLLMNTGETPVMSKNGLLTTIAWGLDGKVQYALEGSVFVCGAAVQWLRDELDIVADAPTSEAMALSVEDTAGVYVVPAFVGLGAPYWDPYARGAILGITRGANKNHIVRATLDSMAYQCCDLLDAMNRDAASVLPGGPADISTTGPDAASAHTAASSHAASALTALKVDGGACANNYLMQFQADMLGCEVLRPSCIETTSLGAAYLAGLATGYFRDLADVKAGWQVDQVFVPGASEAVRQANLSGWHKAVDRAMGWAK